MIAYSSTRSFFLWFTTGFGWQDHTTAIFYNNKTPYVEHCHQAKVKTIYLKHKLALMKDLSTTLWYTSFKISNILPQHVSNNFSSF